MYFVWLGGTLKVVLIVLRMNIFCHDSRNAPPDVNYSANVHSLSGWTYMHFRLAWTQLTRIKNHAKWIIATSKCSLLIRDSRSRLWLTTKPSFTVTVQYIQVLSEYEITCLFAIYTSLLGRSHFASRGCAAYFCEGVYSKKLLSWTERINQYLSKGD